MIKEYLISNFYHNQDVKSAMPQGHANLLSGEITPTNAVEHLLNIYQK